MPPRVVPLVECRADGAYALCEDTLSWLSERKTPFATMSCAGKFRTGKSFLMNRFVSSPSPEAGFGVGDTVQACTRGIWVCTDFLKGHTRTCS